MCSGLMARTCCKVFSQSVRVWPGRPYIRSTDTFRNPCRKGLYSRHNTKYWTGGEYLGFGPSASSDFAGKRFTLIADLQGYINGIRTGGDIMDDIQEIPLQQRKDSRRYADGQHGLLLQKRNNRFHFIIPA